MRYRTTRWLKPTNTVLIRALITVWFNLRSDIPGEIYRRHPSNFAIALDTREHVTKGALLLDMEDALDRWPFVQGVPEIIFLLSTEHNIARDGLLMTPSGCRKH